MIGQKVMLLLKAIHLPMTKMVIKKRNGLKKNPMFKGNYTFGKEGRVRVGHNLADELVNKMTEDIFFNRYKDINPRLNINAKLGPNKQTDLGLGINLGKNKGFNLNIGRSF